jgi:hypothetical protein
MGNIELGAALFRSSANVGPSKMKVGMTGPAGINISRYHTAMTGSKISTALRLFDKLFESVGSIAAYEDKENENVLIFYNKVPVLVQFNPFGVEYKVSSDFEDSKSTGIKYLPAVISQLSSFSDNDELKDAFTNIVNGYESASDTSAKQYLFCDSFYYGFAISHKEISYDVVDKTVLENQLQAGFRSGLFVPIPLLDSTVKKYLGKAEYDATPEKKKERKKKTSNFLQECKEDKYKVLYEWPEELKSKIVDKKFLDTYEITPEFEEIVKKIKYHADRIVERMDMGLTGAEAIGKDALNILILGKPGTGKTTLAYGLSAATGMPVCTTVHSKHTEEDEYEGKTKIIEGKPEFVETDALIFHEKGGIDVNEEINLADPSVTMGGLGQKLEYPYIVKKNGYETIVRHPLNVVIATMNVGTNGSNPLNQALANRFRTPYILDDPTRETFIGILEKATGKPKDLCTWVYNAYERVTSFLASPEVGCEDIIQNLSIRTCIGAIENMDEGQSSTRALVNSIVGAIAVVDLETARRVKDEVIESLPLAPTA